MAVSEESLRRSWTPVANTLARLQRVSAEEPGSMQEFATGLALSDLLLRLHTIVFVSALERTDARAFLRLGFELARANGTGIWLTALERALAEHARFGLSTSALRSTSEWLTKKRRSADTDYEDLTSLAGEVNDLRQGLAHGDPDSRAPRSPRELFQALIEIRNKTAHGAYGSAFYQQHSRPVVAASQWLATETPLWEGELLAVVNPEAGAARKLRGPSLLLAAELERVEPGPCRGEALVRFADELWPTSRLLHVESGDDSAFIANGSWNELDCSADFLCHARAASEPGQGTLRLSIPVFARPPLPAIGDLVGERRRYRIVELLGEGSEAVAFLARDEISRRLVVLKTFREADARTEALLKTQRKLAQLHHRGLPRVLEVGRWDDPYHLIFDHVPGAPLDRRWRNVRGSREACLRIGLDILSALGYMHRNGLVHRDVAPDNIFIPRDPDAAVQLLDLDQAAPIGATGPAGTSRFRAPEVDAGAPWHEGADIYSLGVVLYLLLTGAPPYVRGKTRSPDTPWAPHQPTAAEQTKHGAQLLKLLKRCGSPRPSDRCKSARGFARALQRAGGV